MTIQKLNELITQGESIQAIHNTNMSRNTSLGILDLSGLAPTKTHEWMSNVKIFAERHAKTHPLYANLTSALFHEKNNMRDVNKILGILNSISNDDAFFENLLDASPDSRCSKVAGTSTERHAKMLSNDSVFIVHGHDDAAKEATARFIESLGIKSIILHEQTSQGATIIEKLEKYSDVGFAVVLYTPCDDGKSSTETDYNKRARQNVVFEHGYLLAHLGRARVCALVKGTVETPGDISGVVYVPMDDASAWKMHLFRELRTAGYNIDANRFL